VRQALAELAPGLAAGVQASGLGLAASTDGHARSQIQRSSPPEPVRTEPVTRPGQYETVAIRNDADLAAFVSRLLHDFENPKHREDLRQGRLRFRLDRPPAHGSYEPSHRFEKGAVTEAVVNRAARSGARIVLGPGAVLTPLARDRARAAGVSIEKER
jgi:hypothetical protein